MKEIYYKMKNRKLMLAKDLLPTLQMSNLKWIRAIYFIFCDGLFSAHNCWIFLFTSTEFTLQWWMVERIFLIPATKNYSDEFHSNFSFYELEKIENFFFWRISQFFIKFHFILFPWRVWIHNNFHFKESAEMHNWYLSWYMTKSLLLLTSYS